MKESENWKWCIFVIMQELHELFSEGRDKFELGQRRGRQIGYSFGIFMGSVLWAPFPAIAEGSKNTGLIIYIGLGLLLIFLSAIRKNIDSKELTQKQKRVGTVGLVRHGINSIQNQSMSASIGCILILYTFGGLFDMPENYKNILYAVYIIIAALAFIYYVYLMFNPPKH